MAQSHDREYLRAIVQPIYFYYLTDGCPGRMSATKGWWASSPPSTHRFWPVMNADSSEARKTTAAAMSSGRPRRGVRWWRNIVASTASRPGAAFAWVTMKPGEMALHRTPRLPNSVATYRVRLIRAAFEAPYAGLRRSPVSPEPDEVLMTEPPPRAIMYGTAACTATMAPRRLTRIISSQTSGSAVATGRSWVAASLVAAALLCSTSRPP